MDRYLKAQGYGEIKNEVINLTTTYNPEFINTTIDLQELALGIKETKNARICLYGPAGTGKSAYGRYISEVTNQKVIIKKGSDLLSKFLGETEQNIAKAFKEAKNEDAVLVFDEVDSFLSDRADAQQSWEVSQVNEMLVQMENFDGVFIATTNLMDNLDKAAIRRFDLKLNFDYLKPSQAWEMFQIFAQDLNIEVKASLKSKVQRLRLLTAGDFATVTRQNRFRPLVDAKDLLLRLQNEIEAKNSSSSKVMGFLK